MIPSKEITEKALLNGDSVGSLIEQANTISEFQGVVVNVIEVCKKIELKEKQGQATELEIGFARGCKTLKAIETIKQDLTMLQERLGKVKK